MFDVLFKNARVLDGSGNAWFHADEAVQAGRIGAIGKLTSDARTAIDARGNFLASGFIDAHIHGNVMPLADPQHEAGLRQGVSTHIIGHDGIARPCPRALVGDGS